MAKRVLSGSLLDWWFADGEGMDLGLRVVGGVERCPDGDDLGLGGVDDSVEDFGLEGVVVGEADRVPQRVVRGLGDVGEAHLGPERVDRSLVGVAGEVHRDPDGTVRAFDGVVGEAQRGQDKVERGFSDGMVGEPHCGLDGVERNFGEADGEGLCGPQGVALGLGGGVGCGSVGGAEG